jgi:hypothetical protein
MANSPVGGGASPFNALLGVSAIHDIDAAFWQAHAAWRALEDQFEVYGGETDEDPVAAALLDRADLAREAMFAAPVQTATALQAKLEACRDGDAASVIDIKVGGVRVFELLERDLRRLVSRETGASAVC